MPQAPDLTELFGLNAAFIESLYADYASDPASVGEEWRRYFEGLEPGTIAALQEHAGKTNGAAAKPAAPVASAPVAPARMAPDAKPAAPAPSEDRLEPIAGVGARIVANMEASLEVPTATSVRTIPVKVLEENRRI
ncbi:MAG TPA: multifunctional oxoglutarate decarboxylase/oxoglutarate dehydrogenase thiamine pyrophosphate-binding subunit/dihydrolipoyllysine-residue succinyltransferase subunit, partial [Planctomycetota bacterium]|nr:multifunctional oxoglutarate decarboxylase/oxoglutarate dehydrogenase thiamine pyrophosphate-binding subunit/dihydrolipoyllysine-residue succinyltransferase subunit [Planctomycetota bacterium]